MISNSAKNYGAVRVYGRSKLCNILFTRELARRLGGTSVTANCLHPGFRRHALWRPKWRFALTPRLASQIFRDITCEGAETIVYLASSPDVAEYHRGIFLQVPPD